MAKHKAGIHKKIASIFDGVPIPKGDGVRRPSGESAADRTEVYAPPKPLTPYPQAPTAPKPQRPVPDRTAYAPPKPPPQRPETRPIPTPLQPVPPPPKPAPAKLPEAAAIKTIKGKSLWQRIKNKLFAPKPGVRDTRQKTMTILIPILFIVLVFVLIRVFGAASRQTGGPQRAEPRPANALPAVASNSKIDWQIPGPYPTTLRDPMQVGSVATTEAETDKPIVKGIVYSEDEPTAIIGARVVREGEKVHGATIIKISKDSVEFEMDGERWTQKVQR